jgi:hypothetical protein
MNTCDFSAENTTIVSKPEAYSHIQLTHPLICYFYANNPTVSPETVNLCIIKLFENTQSQWYTPTNGVANPAYPPSQTYHKQITEMTNMMMQIKDDITTINAGITQQYLSVKTEFLNEFRSVWSQTCCVTRRNILLENNRKLIHSIENITYTIRTIQGKQSFIGEKAGGILKQFQKIMNANVETILSNPTDTTSMVNEFSHNFETNSTHMIHTIIQLLQDYVTVKETQMKQINESFSTNGENAISAYCKFIYELTDFVQFTKNARTQGLPNVSGQTMISSLSRLYNTGYIQSDDTDKSIYVLTRDDKPTICIQQLQIKERNVNADEIVQFHQTIKAKNTHGILVSQYTGITSKPNLYIDIHHNRVIVYVHSLEYSPEKLQTAIDIVDTISAKLADFNNSSEQKYTIPKDILDEINREYQTFIAQKETIITTLKETHKKLISQMEEFRFISLDKYLSTRYSYFKKQGFVCNLCNVFTVPTLKGLAAHKRGCSRKMCTSAPVGASPSLCEKAPFISDKSEIQPELLDKFRIEV